MKPLGSPLRRRCTRTWREVGRSPRRRCSPVRRLRRGPPYRQPRPQLQDSAASRDSGPLDLSVPAPARPATPTWRDPKVPRELAPLICLHNEPLLVTVTAELITKCSAQDLQPATSGARQDSLRRWSTDAKLHAVPDIAARYGPMPRALGRSGRAPDRLLDTLGDCPWLGSCCAGFR